MAEKLKILIAEDEEVTRQLFQIAFQDGEQFEVRVVSDGEQALVVLQGMAARYRVAGYRDAAHEWFYRPEGHPADLARHGHHGDHGQFRH